MEMTMSWQTLRHFKSMCWTIISQEPHYMRKKGIISPLMMSLEK